MRQLSSSLQQGLKDCNKQLKDKYNLDNIINKQELRTLISNHLGKIISLTKLSDKELKSWTAKGAITGVDGSINTVGGNYPHYITLLQALGKNSSQNDQELFIDDIFSPLLVADRRRIRQKAKQNKISDQEAAEKIKTMKMATLEVKVARQSILEYQPRLVMMDGSLIRYRSEASREWEQLVELALETDTLLVGVIEEVGSDKIAEDLKSKLPKLMHDMYDRELLFGLLDYGEMIKVDGLKTGLKKAFVRSSKDPGVIGVDLLTEQSQQIEFIVSLLLALTPQDSRGIPIWLDIVDEQVRISHKMVQSLIDNYIDQDLKMRLFHTKRKDRIY